MAGRHAARRAPGGGVGIPASRPRLARLATGASAGALALGLAVYPAAASERYGEALAGAGGLAVALLALSLLVGWTSGIAPALALLAGEYAVSLALRDLGTVDTAAPLVGAGLLVLAELAYWSVELGRPGREETGLLVRRLAALTVLACLSVGLGALVVVVTALPLGGGLLWDAVGVVAAAGVLAVVASLARRESSV